MIHLPNQNYLKLYLNICLHSWAPEETIESLGLGNANTVNATEKEVSNEVNKDIFKDVSWRKFTVRDNGFLQRQFELCAVNNVCQRWMVMGKQTSE